MPVAAPTHADMHQAQRMAPGMMAGRPDPRDPGLTGTAPRTGTPDGERPRAGVAVVGLIALVAALVLGGGFLRVLRRQPGGSISVPTVAGIP